MRSAPATLVILAAAVAALELAAAETPPAQIVGGIEGVVFVCTPIDRKSVQPGLDLLQRAAAQRNLDLPALRRTEDYKLAYNSEVNRLLSLPQRERLCACQHAW